MGGPRRSVREVKAEDARRALRSFADLTPNEIRPIHGGWAYWTFEVDGRLIFRFPRDEGTAEDLGRELRLLPALAPTVSFRVPEPRWVGSWNGHPFWGYRKIEGRPLGAGDPNARAVLLGELASMVAELHSFPTHLACELLGMEGTTRAWKARYEALRDEAAERVVPLLGGRASSRMGKVFAAFLRDPFDFTPVLVHGDLGAEHVLVDSRDRRLIGLIDFETARIGDPAIDFVGFWITLGPERTAAIVGAYSTPIDSELVNRVRHYWWMGSLHAVLSGLDEERQDIVEDGLRELHRRLPLDRAI